MAYDKHTWTCDEPITVERLNHIEDGIANAGGGDCGFECEDRWVTLTEESVTTTSQDGTIRGQLSYSQFIDAEVIKVTFNGTEYECPRIETVGINAYGGFGQGGPDFSEYPFAIGSITMGANMLFTETAGTHTLKIEVEETVVTTTPCFDKARGYSCEEEMGVLTEESVTTELDGDEAYGDLSYSQLINQDTITVTFNGTEYECEVREDDGVYLCGATHDMDTDTWDWSEYPFAIFSSQDGSAVVNTIATQTAGTYTVKIEAMQETVTVTPCFKRAVQSIASPLIVEATLAPGEATNISPSYLKDSATEIAEAMTTRGAVVRDPYGNLYPILFATNRTVAIASAVYNAQTQQTDFSVYLYEVGINGLRYPRQSFA